VDWIAPYYWNIPCHDWPDNDRWPCVYAFMDPGGHCSWQDPTLSSCDHAMECVDASAAPHGVWKLHYKPQHAEVVLHTKRRHLYLLWR
jgi:hypothetical protein